MSLINSEKVSFPLKVFNNPDDVDIEKWMVFCQEHKHHSIFQDLSFYSFWKNQKNNDPFIIFIESAKGDCLCYCMGNVQCEGSFLLNYFSKRAIIYGAPIMAENATEEVFEKLLNSIQATLKKSVVYIEFRNFFTQPFPEIFKKNNWYYTPYLNYIIDLTSKEEVFAKFNSERRRQIRKGIRDGVLVSFDKSIENIEDVYDVLLHMYTHRIKKPIPPFSYFDDMMKLDNAGVVSVSFDGKVIGGGFFLKDENTIYDWYRGGLDIENPKKYPSSITDWSIMSYGIENNIKYFDFMGAGIKGQKYGVRVYKSRFGGELVEYGRYTKIVKPTVYKVGKRLMKFSSKLLFTIKKRTSG